MESCNWKIQGRPESIAFKLLVYPNYFCSMSWANLRHRRPITYQWRNISQVTTAKSSRIAVSVKHEIRSGYSFGKWEREYLHITNKRIECFETKLNRITLLLSFPLSANPTENTLHLHFVACNCLLITRLAFDHQFPRVSRNKISSKLDTDISDTPLSTRIEDTLFFKCYSILSINLIRSIWLNTMNLNFDFFKYGSFQCLLNKRCTSANLWLSLLTIEIILICWNIGVNFSRLSSYLIISLVRSECTFQSTES